MLNINGVKIYTQTELLENMVRSIKRNIPFALQSQHVLLRAAEIGDIIGESKEYVMGYLSKSLGLRRLE